jgi:2-dehydro-3-deoxyphosphogluconate aldolase/(4S)-4-hydroxy-2-oxoglutarate aldolase
MSSEAARILEEIYRNGIVPVVVMDDPKDAVPLAEAVSRGGLNAMEITFRTAAAPEAIAAITEAFPGMAVGAGTVLSAEDMKRARDAGAKFIVSPGYDPDVVDRCLKDGIPVIPGIATASEAQAALSQGLSMVKLYPAAQLGGPAYLKSLASVYPTLRFMPTGGIRPETVCSYLDVPSVAAVGGTWLCPKEMIAEGRFGEIEAIVRDSVNRMFEFKLLHIGLNSRDESEAREKGGSFAEMFNLPLIELPTAFFAGTMMEIIKTPFLGEHGHIAVSTNYIDRAMAYFERRGYAFRPTEGERKDLVAAYFEKEIGGFAVHLRRSLDR